MKYRYTAVYSLKGVRMPTGEGDIEVVADSIQGLRAILTQRPDSYTYEGDRSVAVASRILDRLFGGHAQAGKLDEHVAEKIGEARASRKREVGSDPSLVLVAEGEVACFDPSNQHEEEDFVVCVDGAPKDPIRDRFQPAITALVLSLAGATGTLLEVKRIGDSVVFFRDDGKPVYSYTFSLSGSPYVSSLVSAHELKAACELYQLFARDPSLQRVQRLLRSSLETQADSLRSFLAAWTAAEILVNKLFGAYEEKFFGSIAEEEHGEARKKYLRRIREVMKGKYGLIDRFAAMTVQLSPETANADLTTLTEAKRIRDKMLHGESIDEADLPVKPVQDLACRYLQLHLQSGIAAGTK
jgi:hypothetical protein